MDTEAMGNILYAKAHGNKMARHVITTAFFFGLAVISQAVQAAEPKQKDDGPEKIAEAYAEELIIKMNKLAEKGDYDGAIKLKDDVPQQYEKLIRQRINVAVKLLESKASDIIEKELREIADLIEEKQAGEAEERFKKLAKLKYSPKQNRLKEVAEEMEWEWNPQWPSDGENQPEDEQEDPDAVKQKKQLLNNQLHQKFIQTVDKARKTRIADMARKYKEGQNARLLKLSSLKTALSDLEVQPQPNQRAKDRAAVEIKKLKANVKLMEDENKKIIKETTAAKEAVEKEIEKAYERLAAANEELTSHINEGQDLTEADMKEHYTKALQGE